MNDSLVLTGRRSSGLLLHPTSLPGPHGNGDIGPAAHAFIDFLGAGGQRWWQMLPIGPPGAAPGYSPYSSYSAFAGSPWLISLEMLARDGLLTPRELTPPAAVRKDDPQATQQFRHSRLRAAFARFEQKRDLHEAFDIFLATHETWVDDFALFSAIKSCQNGRSWLAWPTPLRLRLRSAIRDAERTLRNEIRFHQFVQFSFDQHWSRLRSYGHTKRVGMIGDIPIFVALDSADVWANPRLFLLDSTGRPKVVSGCPPDVFCVDGQLWGHPQYDWEAHRRTGFDWWVKRFESLLHCFDAVRIDHFLGFHRAWAVPASAKTARNGTWLPGPGDDLFRAVRKAIGKVPVIAEDLGAVTTEAMRLRDRWKFPGMRVMQFGFSDGGEYHLPHTFPHRCVAYTGTHDNDTVAGWFKELAQSNGHVDPHRERTRDKALRYLNCRDLKQIHWSMIRAAMMSVADTVLFPIQDVLGLGNEARMNVPGVANDQWRWRLKDGMLTSGESKKLKELTELSDREGR